MLTAEQLIKEIYLLPFPEREKIARHIVCFGINTSLPPDIPERLDMKQWQQEISKEPFNLGEASDYLGVSSVTLKKWIKEGRISYQKAGREYRFDVIGLKKFKKTLNSGFGDNDRLNDEKHP
jgi:excisionase family DNA binding protein